MTELLLSALPAVGRPPSALEWFLNSLSFVLTVEHIASWQTPLFSPWSFPLPPYEKNVWSPGEQTALPPSGPIPESSEAAWKTQAPQDPIYCNMSSLPPPLQSSPQRILAQQTLGYLETMTDLFLAVCGPFLLGSHHLWQLLCSLRTEGLAKQIGRQHPPCCLAASDSLKYILYHL